MITFFLLHGIDGQDTRFWWVDDGVEVVNAKHAQVVDGLNSAGEILGG
jgi:hypothetical protein